METHFREGVWFSAAALARAEGELTLDGVREVSRRLSNLHRFGHLDRRERSKALGGRERALFEYRIPAAVSALPWRAAWIPAGMY